MALMKIGDDVWTRTAIKSTFKILIPNHPNSRFDRDSTMISGLGWRFSCSVNPESSSESTIYVLPDGTILPTWRISVFFDPHLNFDSPEQQLLLRIRHRDWNIYLHHVSWDGSNHCDNCGAPPETGLSIPRSIDGKLERLLADTMSGKEAVDVMFYAFTRKSPRYVTHPRAIFAKTTLLEGYSDELDLMISGGGFSEAKLVDLDRYHIDKDRLDDYDYMSDSDLDSDDEGMEDDTSDGRIILPNALETSFEPREATEVPLPLSCSPSTSRSPSRSESPPSRPESPTRRMGRVVVPGGTAFKTWRRPSRPQSPARRMGRVVVLGGTAFKTWRSLLYYLYTSKLSFSSAPPLARNEYRIPQCSAKSMYRLADKLGLDELKSISLSSIKTNLTPENVIQQVFSEFTSRYSEVQDIEVEFVLNNFPALREEIDNILDGLCKGDRPYCVDVLRKIVAGRTRALTPGRDFERQLTM
ncbi:hypothetical protein B0H13DRAFT_2419353 [Mycena leptocephala]|nr:hypothetical protein B0H13DRAFT_2419353 [Mycena leptocephala]